VKATSKPGFLSTASHLALGHGAVEHLHALHLLGQPQLRQFQCLVDLEAALWPKHIPRSIRALLKHADCIGSSCCCFRKDGATCLPVDYFAQSRRARLATCTAFLEGLVHGPVC
jgi:hypothetical protein